MALGEIGLTLEGAAGEEPIGTPERQAELKEAARELKRLSGAPVSEMVTLKKMVGGGSEHLGGYFIAAAPAAASAISVVAGAWLQGRFGRRARVKIGDVEVEARTPAEVEQLLELVHRSQNGMDDKPSS